MEYIQSTGTQWIDTGLTTGKFVHDIAFTTVSNDNLMGNSAGAGFYWGQRRNASGNGYELATRYITGMNSTERRVVEYDNLNNTKILSAGGQTVTYSVSGSVSTNYSLFRIWGSDQYYVNAKLWGFQAYDANGKIVRDMVPAKRNSDNEVGLYDNVNDVFYTNKGSGEFYAPGDRTLPAGYTQLQYLQGGRKDNAYIDLGYAATSTMQTLLQASIVERNSGDNLLFGSANGDSFSNSDPYAIDVFPKNVLLPAGAFEGGGTDLYKIDASNEIGQVYQYKIHYSTVGQIGVDATVKTIPTKTVNDRHLYLFGFGGKENQYVGNYCVPVMRAYRLTQWDNGVMIHDFIPARNSSGVLGMYDLMDNNPATAFHTNAGTGNFTAGPVVQ